MVEMPYKERASSIESQNGARIEAEMFEVFATFNNQIRNFLKKAHAKKQGDKKYLEQRLTDIEEERERIITSFQKEILEEVSSKKSRHALQFRLRLFSFMHKLFMGEDKVIGASYKARFDSGKNNGANINRVLDTQYIAWALLREPHIDVIEQVRDVMRKVYKDPRPNGNGDIEKYFNRYEQGIVGHAGVHALYVEDGYYVSAPPDPVLDTEHGVDLLAIKQGEFLVEIKRLGLSGIQKEKLITDVGSYKEANGGAWFQEVAKHPSLAKLVTLVQVKTHSKKRLNSSNISVNGGFLDDSLRITDDMLKDVTLRGLIKKEESVQVKGLSKNKGDNEGYIILSQNTIFDAASDFARMSRVLPEANLAFVDMHINAAHLMISRRIYPSP